MGTQMEMPGAQVEQSPKKRGGKPRKGPEAVNGFLTRVQVARALGLSLSGVRSLEGTKLPVHTRDGVHLFDVRDVETFRVRRTVKGPMPEGSAAAEVFALIDEGVRPVDIVKRLRIHPDTVEKLVRQHARMCGAIMLEEQELEELLRVSKLGTGPRPCNSRDVIALMKSAVEHTHPCVKCRDSTARFCGDCVESATQRAPRSAARSRHG